MKYDWAITFRLEPNCYSTFGSPDDTLKEIIEKIAEELKKHIEYKVPCEAVIRVSLSTK